MDPQKHLSLSVNECQSQRLNVGGETKMDSPEWRIDPLTLSSEMARGREKGAHESSLTEQQGGRQMSQTESTFQSACPSDTQPR
ncbi:uncharacterized [Tachysurus ichikawai]